ncbi:MAG: DinB family protein [Acidobacteriia bacterium]|nr:DinB family protein [Terriglobia bacterium]
MSESARLADQIRRAFEGDAWHGDSILELLSGVNSKTAASHPIKDAHSIWELLLHIAAWDGAVIRRTGGQAVELKDKENFPQVKDTRDAAGTKAMADAKQTHDQLVKAVAAFPDSRLQEQVPGKKEDYYNYFYLFSGIVQHELYHAGQIALLKKAQGK